MDQPQVRHRVVVPPRLGERPPALDAELLEVFRSTTIAEVSDLVGRLYTMDGGIAPLVPSPAVTVGFALTVKAWAGDNLAIHGGLAHAQEHDVLVVDWQGYRGGGGSGSKLLLAPRARGLAGVVIDGCWRDPAEVRAMNFPLFGRGFASFAPAKIEPGEVNVPVSCGGVIVEPGDVVVAGEGGVVIVPRRSLAEVSMALVSTGTAVAGSAPTDEQRTVALRNMYLEAFGARAGIRA